MNQILKLFLSMSFSGSLLILFLLLGKRFLKDKINRQWQYYIWAVVVLRLLLPFGPEASLLGRTYQAVDRAVARTVPLRQQSLPDAPESVPAPAAGRGTDNVHGDSPAGDFAAFHPFHDIGTLLMDHIWLVWLMAALGLMIRKATIYQGFIRYIKAGSVPVSDMEMLDRLSMAAEQASVKRPIELWVNPLVSSPLLIGFFRPCIVLPGTDVSEKNFQYILVHELTHYRRRDMFYKWLVQFTVCLHWFNPLVHLMGREITRACEFSCDEAVLARMGYENAQDYGQTLLDAMAAVWRYRETPGAVTLSENKRLLKERLSAIVNFRKKSKAMRFLTGALTLLVISGAAFIGVYPVVQAGSPAGGNPAAYDSQAVSPRAEKGGQGDMDGVGIQYSQMAEKGYEAYSLPLFQLAFCRLDEAEQGEWLDRIYADGEIAFMGAAVAVAEEDCAAIRNLAERIYEDGEIAFFSVLAPHMSEETLLAWLDRALEDGDISFQSVLFDALDRDEEYDELKEAQEEAWDEAQAAEYRAAGVTMDGKDYYYREQLVDIFLDMRPGKAFYTLSMNPEGTVNIRILRNDENEITGVAYMTEAEVAELLGERGEDSDDEADAETIPVDLDTIAAGESVCLGEYTLAFGDRIRYDILAETGTGMTVFFDRGEKNTVYWAAHNLRQEDEPLKCSAEFTVEPPIKPGTFKLYIQATYDTLEKVKGSISIVPAGAS
ncbi:MAG: hypothetical protein HFH97_19910 [Lachnospiraceae bacterium]|nr:M56 family metallopeptidase [uncultured Acetatifactor sp.]MCI9574829.1 hypothetical protein [Lachnospiraceae bacterium]